MDTPACHRHSFESALVSLRGGSRGGFVISFPVTGHTAMKITIVTPPKNKAGGKWCPWMIDTPVEIIDSERK